MINRRKVGVEKSEPFDSRATLIVRWCRCRRVGVVRGGEICFLFGCLLPHSYSRIAEGGAHLLLLLLFPVAEMVMGSAERDDAAL